MTYGRGTLWGLYGYEFWSMGLVWDFAFSKFLYTGLVGVVRQG